MDVKHTEINMAFANKVFNQGLVKEAEEQMSSLIRTYAREKGILRRAMPPITVGRNDIHIAVDTDNPVKIFDIQPDSRAYSIPFNGNAPIKRFEGKRAQAEFTRLETDEFKIEKERIMTYQYEVDKQLIEQGVKDLMKVEDEIFIELLNGIAADNSLTADVSTVSGGLNDKIKEARKAFRATRPANRQVPIATVVCNENVYDEFMSLPSSVYATQFNEKILEGGVSNLESPFGLNWVVSNKTDLVPDGTMYLLAPQEYLGGFYLYEDATTFMKTEKNILRISTYEVPAIGVFTTGLLKVTI